MTNTASTGSNQNAQISMLFFIRINLYSIKLQDKIQLVSKNGSWIVEEDQELKKLESESSADVGESRGDGQVVTLWEVTVLVSCPGKSNFLTLW